MRFFIKFVVTCLTSLWILCPSSFIQPVSATQTEALRDRLIQTMTAVVILAAEQGGQQNDLVPMANALNCVSNSGLREVPGISTSSLEEFEKFLCHYLVVRVANLYSFLSEESKQIVRDLPVTNFHRYNIGSVPMFQHWVTGEYGENWSDFPQSDFREGYKKWLDTLLQASLPTEGSLIDLTIGEEVQNSLSQLMSSWLRSDAENNQYSTQWRIQLSSAKLATYRLQLEEHKNHVAKGAVVYNKMGACFNNHSLSEGEKSDGSASEGEVSIGDIAKATSQTIEQAKEFVKTLVPVEEATSYGGVLTKQLLVILEDCMKQGRLSRADSSVESGDSSVGSGDVTFDSDSDSLAGSIGKAYNRGRGPEKSKRFRHRKARKRLGGVLTKHRSRVILEDCMKKGCVLTKHRSRVILEDCMKKGCVIKKSGKKLILEDCMNKDSDPDSLPGCVIKKSGKKLLFTDCMKKDLLRPAKILALSSDV
eukprot:GHVQ01006095.1.p1 GENE.GHVQ01006095.1~~GHVQ01006095.1.p1  ORF type:complete len:485 (+),score=23.32 GHVQ01006095.1:22-1455(+)